MPTAPFTAYLAGYPEPVVAQVGELIAAGRLGPHLLQKYPHAHPVRTDKALYDYVQQIKSASLRNAAPLNKVLFDSKLRDLRQALGTHTRSARVQGGNLRTQREIRIAALFRFAPAEFLRMIVAHELAHLRESEHNRAFYQLCRHIEPAYAQMEFDLRLYLCHLAADGEPLWA